MNRPTSDPTFATDANYPAGAKPWSGQPTKIDPTAGERAQGAEPLVGYGAQQLNAVLGEQGDWIKYLASTLSSIQCGDGSDGNAVMNGVNTFAYATLGIGVYTLTRDVYFNNLTLSAAVDLNPGAFRFYVNGTATVPATASINVDGFQSIAKPIANGALAVGASGPAGRTGNGAGTAGDNAFSIGGGAGGAGGAGFAGGAGGTGGLGPLPSAVPNMGGVRSIFSAVNGFVLGLNVTVGPVYNKLQAISGGASGGSGGCGGGGGSMSGYGGAGGGVLCGAVRSLVLGGRISANGAAGGAGTGTGGGGGGGGGGYVGLYIGSRTGAGTITASAGAGGGNAGGGSAGVVGSAGVDGNVVAFDLTTVP